MDNNLVMGIINNVILLLGLGIIYSLIPIDGSKTKLSYKIMIGTLVSTIVIFVMLTPFEIAEGVVLDTRSILISIVAFFFGPIPGIMTIISAATLRIYQGGVGAVTGVLVIVSSGIIGYLFKKYRFDKIKDRKVHRLFELYLFGLVVHIVMLVMFIALPKDIRLDIIKDIYLYVLLIYPVVTVIYGVLLFMRHDIITSNNQLLRSQSNFVAAIKEAPIPIIIHSEDGEIITVNQTWTDLSGYAQEDIPTIFDWIKKAYKKSEYDKALKNIKDLFSNGDKVHEGEIQIRTESNKIRTWDFYSSSLGILPDGRKALISLATDVTARKVLEEKLTRLSFHDELTGLYNRRFYAEELKRLDTKRNYPLTLLMGDVNGLKIINDSFGHLAGDELLVTTAKVIKSICRTDDIVVRLGGDEFIIILPKTSPKEAEILSDRIKTELYKHYIESINISISFGHASKTSDSQSIEKVFIEAENSMYQNKLFESPSIRGYAIDIILNTIFEIEPSVKEHSENVSEYSTRIATAMNLSNTEIHEIKTAALLHDIGKIVTPVSILTKKGILSASEYGVVKKHPESGYRILTSGPNMENIAKYCLHHHERYDGTGYPNGLSKEDIPLQSRIISLADAYDAMVSVRSYKECLTREEAIQEIKDNMGTQFDPIIAKIYIEEVLEKNEGMS